MIRKVLIANRGEIALRIIRACRDMNIDMVAVYSEADREALFASLVGESVCIGPAKSGDSYLNQSNVIEAALKTGCDAVHPGFGFLSENSDFAAKVQESGLIFIGPPSRAIEILGNKSAARALAKAQGVPVVPGSEGKVETTAQALTIAETIGYPVLIKASAGGGGRGMRRAGDAKELETAFADATAEALACFGDGTVYLEKLIENPRHIEVQILADAHGHVIHLGERECSMQRRHQKILEEAPAKGITPAFREALGQYAIRVAQGAGYQNAGTVEFILDNEGNPYFIEMNTRIQVEHPVTEVITGIDLVREQLRIASGLELSLKQEDVTLRGHAIECRICAEDPVGGFAPCPGKIDFLHLPGGYGVRIDSDLYAGCTISPWYDSMIAKVIVHGQTRSEALYRMRRALEEFIVKGVKTNLSLQYMILYHPEFIAGRYDTGFIAANLDRLLTPVMEDRML